MKESKSVSVVDAFDLPQGSKARFFPSDTQHSFEREPISSKRRRAAQMREAGIDEKTIRRKGLDEGTLNKKERRQKRRAEEREATQNRIAANKEAVRAAGKQYKATGRSKGNHRRFSRELKYSEVLARISSPFYQRNKATKRLQG